MGTTVSLNRIEQVFDHQGFAPSCFEQVVDSTLVPQEIEQVSPSSHSNPVISLIISKRWDEAILSAREVENVFERDVNLEAICMRLLRSDSSAEERAVNAEMVVHISENYISSPSFKKGLCFWIFRAFVDCGKMDRALDVLGAMFAGGEDHSVLRAACRIWIGQIDGVRNSGDIGRFLGFVEDLDQKIHDPKLKTGCYKLAIIALTRRDDVNGLLRVLDPNLEQHLKIQVFSAIRDTVEDPEEISEFCDLAIEFFGRAEAQALISDFSSRLLKKNNIDRFLKIVQYLSKEEIISAVNSFIQKKNVSAVLRIVECCEDNSIKTRSLISVSSFVETGEEVAFFCKIAKSLSRSDQEKVTVRLAGSLVTRDLVDVFLAVTKEIPSIERRETLLDVAFGRFTRTRNFVGISKVQKAKEELVHH